MKFGVNYTPRQGWFYSWLDFDAGAVSADFAQIKSIGADHVRIFPLWPLLQPNRNLIRTAAVDAVVTTAQLAHEAGLESSIDVLQGHLSSFDFLPSWVSTWHDRNIFTDPQVVAAQQDLVRVLGEALRDIPGTTGLTLGNEFMQFAAQRHPHRHETSPQGALTWLDSLLGEAKRVWPGGRHVQSHDDDLWFEPSQPFGPHAAVTRGDSTTVHSWIFGALGPRYGVDSPLLPWFARYLCELAAAWSNDPHRPIWLQEVGAPENYVSVAKAPEFLIDTVDTLMGAHGGGVSPNLEAITWWCSHDVNSELVDFPYFEHTLGLIDENGKTKPIGDAFKASAEKWASVDSDAGNERESVAVVVDEKTRNLSNPYGQIFDAWIGHALDGDVRALRLADRGGED
ncbi:glycoside hydrolase 5 family protein [Arcanobacterium bovis]|uniref:Glycosyl hydrolase n=1 Tax=Arcanobacterium bovis TaxID=2529275 RepID=A0A4Q9UYT6_9ACTO|nr:hypothetical protein [Arcanobacterium bovis]TBW20864.1 hypothetical protein EZJ44_08020 [Arcanobacterium bovis]